MTSKKEAVHEVDKDGAVPPAGFVNISKRNGYSYPGFNVSVWFSKGGAQAVLDAPDSRIPSLSSLAVEHLELPHCGPSEQRREHMRLQLPGCRTR